MSHPDGSKECTKGKCMMWKENWVVNDQNKKCILLIR